MAKFPGKILVVEDSPMMRRLYRSVLGSETDTLLFAENGADGLDHAAREPDIELFIVDVNMPEMDGLEFLRRLRADLPFAGAPAIVVSTERAPEDHAAARCAGAAGCLSKPWTPEKLYAAIRAAVSSASE